MYEEAEHLKETPKEFTHAYCHTSKSRNKIISTFDPNTTIKGEP